MEQKEIKLHDGELNIMELLWSNKALAAKDIAKIIKEYVGWEKNTTYTVIKRLSEKGALVREDPGFICRAAISKHDIQITDTNDLLKRLFNNSLCDFFTDYLKTRNLTTEEILSLQQIISDQRF